MKQAPAPTFGLALGRPEFWVVVILATPMFVFGLSWTSSSLVQAWAARVQSQRDRDRPPSRGLIQSGARTAFDGLRKCLVTNMLPSGYPRDMSESPCASAAQTPVLKTNYTIRYTAAPPVPPDGRIPWFFLCGIPSHDEDGVLQTSSFHNGVDWPDSRENRKCWTSTYLAGLQGPQGGSNPGALAPYVACLTDYAANPLHEGYPSREEDMGPAGTGCLSPELLVALAPRRAQFAVYAAGPRGIDGRISTFDLRVVVDSRIADGGENWLLKEDGLIRVARGRFATISDPDLASWNAIAASGAAPLSPALFRDCEQDDAEACERLARSLPTAGSSQFGDSAERQALALTLLRKACDRGRATACAELRARMRDDVAGFVRAIRESCAAGSGAACGLLAHELAGAEADLMLARGCTLADGRSCLEAWRRSGRKTSAQRLQYIEGVLTKVCDTTDPTVCAGLAELQERHTGRTVQEVSELYRRACIFGGDVDACQTAKDIAAGQSLADRSTVSARVLMGCLAGQTDSCAKVRKKGPWPCINQQDATCWTTDGERSTLDALELFCEAGHARACELTPLFTRGGEDTYTTSCIKSHRACFVLLELTEALIPESSRLSAAGFRRRCSDNLEAKCGPLARILEEHRAAPEFLINRLYYQGCRSGFDPEACGKVTSVPKVLLQ